jgi:predicted nucleic acid-binding protein
MMAVADTSFVIDVLAGDEGALRKLDELVGRNEALWMPAVVLHELEYGAGLTRNAKRERDRIRAVEGAMPVVPFDAAQARVAGELEAQLELAGKRPGRVDIQVAALGRLRAEPVLTRDRRFPRVAGVNVESY